MGNLKYNPLLKLNLQEETDAAEIIGDGYNEKMLTFEDFLNDIDTITIDNGQIRRYFLTKNETFEKIGTINFSFAIYCNGYKIERTGGGSFVSVSKYNYIFNSPDCKINISHRNFFTQYYNCKIILNFGIFPNAFNIYNECIFKFINCTFLGGATTAHIRNVQYICVFLACKTSDNSNIITFEQPQNGRIYSDGCMLFSQQFATYINIDSALDINSRGLLPNSVITAALQQLQPDSTLDADSNKPVMNSAVTQEINTITQIIENFQDINVSTLQEFETAIQTGQTANVRIHLTTDITLTQSVTYNLDKIQIYGHDNKINLQNFTFTIEGETAYFNAVRFNANSSVNATTAANYSNAQINIISTVNSARFFFEYVIFMNFVCKSSDNSNTDYVKTFFDVKNGAGTSYPSLHLYFTFCEIMTNYTQSNINNLCAAVNHSGSLHALTVHMVDFWGNNKEDNSCPNWTFSGNTLSGLAKLGWISDGSAIYAVRTNSLTPSYVNQYNPSLEQFINLQNKVNSIFNLQHRTVSNSASYSGGTFTASADIYYNDAFAFVYYTISNTGQGTQPETIDILNTGLSIPKSFYQVVENPLGSKFSILISTDGVITNVYSVTEAHYEAKGQFFVNLVQS